MPNLENNFNNEDFNIISPDGNTTGTFGNAGDYIRVTILNEDGSIVDLIFDEGIQEGVNESFAKPAIFYSSPLKDLEGNNVTEFTVQGAGRIDALSDVSLPSQNEFQIYKNPDGSIYIKPNEILGMTQLGDGNYTIQVDFLHQYSPIINDNSDRFVLKEIASSRREIRIKGLDNPITYLDTNFKNEFNDTLSPGGVYNFDFVLHVGDGTNVPITNFTFDKFSNGQDNQSIILRLYDLLPSEIDTLKIVTIEKEILVTQTIDTYYYSSDVEEEFGTGLNPDSSFQVETGEENSFEDWDDITGSLSTQTVNNLYSGSSFDYPNLNTDFRFFENHTFFGSAKRKLENFKDKVEDIQLHLSDISGSLSSSLDRISAHTSMSSDANDLIQYRTELFDKIQKKIDGFTPYERFLYFDGQQESTASAPGIGKNYARTFAMNQDSNPEDDTENLVEFFNDYCGLPQTYKLAYDKNTQGTEGFPSLFKNVYRVESKPFFNYSSSIYLSFLVKGDDDAFNGSANEDSDFPDVGLIKWRKGDDDFNGYSIPSDIIYREFILRPRISSSQYQRYILEASASHWAPAEDAQHDTELMNDFEPGSTQLTILSGSVKTGSQQIQVGGEYQYLSTATPEPGTKFFGSIMPIGDLFDLRFDKLTANDTAVTQSYFTDIKVTLEDPTDVVPFGNLYHTSSANWTNWYNGMHDSASAFDEINIHNLENNLPSYIQNSSEYDDLKKFLSMIGENFDLIRNHIDGFETFYNRGYDKVNSAPGNLMPILLDNLGWDAILPFSSSLGDYFGQQLSSVTDVKTINENTWKKTLNNLIYLYKTKGTENAVRALLNIYGYPPDVIQINEFGGSNENQLDTTEGVIASSYPSTAVSERDTDLKLLNASGNNPNSSFSTRKQKLFFYNFSKQTAHRTLNLDWWTDSADVNTIEFVYKHKGDSNEQELLRNSGSGTENLWDLRLLPSSDGTSASFEFRLNNSFTGSDAIASNAVSMSTNYLTMSSGQLWNVMLQRMSSSISGSGKNKYRLITSLQDTSGSGTRIKTLAHTSMDVSGGLVNSYVTGGADSNYYANQNWLSSGSRHYLSSSNLYVGRTVTGSFAEIRGWTTALSISKFRQHTLNKFSTVGNTLDSHKNELVYHFKLAENYSSASVSESTQTIINIIDSNPKGPDGNPINYGFTKQAGLVSGSALYGYQLINAHSIGLKDVSHNLINTNKIIADPKKSFISNLNPYNASTVSPFSDRYDRPKRTTSNRLEIGRSPQDYIDNFIIDKLQGFDFERLYANPQNRFSSSYGDFDLFKNRFFDNYDISIDTNKFIRGMENMFNDSIVEGIKKIVPVKSTLSDAKSSIGVTIKPTILEKQKYDHEIKSLEVNPNKFNGEIPIASGSFLFDNSQVESSKDGIVNVYTGSNHMSGSEVFTTKDGITNVYTGSGVLAGSEVFGTKDGFISIYTGSDFTSESELFKTQDAEFSISTGSISLDGNIVTPDGSGSFSTLPSVEDSEIILPNGSASLSVLPASLGSQLEIPISGTNDYIATHYNASFVDIHSSWGTGEDDVHFLNQAVKSHQTRSSTLMATSSEANVNHIDRRNVFNMIGDVEVFSGSSIDSSDFSNQSRFYNRQNITEFVHKKSTYESYMHGNPGQQNGRAIGKTRYFYTSSDGTITLPSNHIRQFSNPWTDRMYRGSILPSGSDSDTKPFIQPTKDYEDYGTASFYRVKVSDGENQIIVRSGRSSRGDDGKIIY